MPGSSSCPQCVPAPSGRQANVCKPASNLWLAQVACLDRAAAAYVYLPLVADRCGGHGYFGGLVINGCMDSWCSHSVSSARVREPAFESGPDGMPESSMACLNRA
eukprot:scaffold61478_cov22-Tisochrysis_lutea.AAC.3